MDGGRTRNIRCRIARRIAGRSSTGGRARSVGGSVIDEGLKGMEPGDGEDLGSIYRGTARSYITQSVLDTLRGFPRHEGAEHPPDYVSSTAIV